MSVVIVDEESFFAELVQAHLEIEGFSVIRFSNASDAYEYLIDLRELPPDFCVLVDVALEPGQNTTIFNEETTEDFLTTGIVLLRSIFSQNSSIKAAQSRFILYTAHHKIDIWRKIQNYASSHEMHCWQKKPNIDAAEIIRLVRSATKTSGL